MVKKSKGEQGAYHTINVLADVLLLERCLSETLSDRHLSLQSYRLNQW